MKTGTHTASAEEVESKSTPTKETPAPRTVEEASVTAREAIINAVPEVVGELIETAKHNASAAKFLFEEAGVKLQGPSVHEHKNCLATLLLSKLKPVPPPPGARIPPPHAKTPPPAAPSATVAPDSGTKVTNTD